MDPVKGVGPSTNAWKALVLPLNYPEIKEFLEENSTNSKSFIFACTHNYALVPGRGLEPPRSDDQRILSPLRLPITPPRHIQDSYIEFLINS